MKSSSLRVTEDVLPHDPGWPKADVVVLPGVPGWKPPDGVDDLEHPFPDTTADAVKLLRSQGFSVEHVIERDKRQRVSLNAAEYWLPVLAFVSQIGANALGDLVAGAVRQLVGSAQLGNSRLHVRFGKADANGAVSFFEAHGNGEEVLEAFKLHIQEESE